MSNYHPVDDQLEDGADHLVDGADSIKIEILRSHGSYEISYEIAGSLVGGSDAMAVIRDLFYRLQANDEAQDDEVQGDEPEPEPVGHHGSRRGRNGGAA